MNNKDGCDNRPVSRMFPCYTFPLILTPNTKETAHVNDLGFPVISVLALIYVQLSSLFGLYIYILVFIV